MSKAVRIGTNELSSAFGVSRQAIGDMVNAGMPKLGRGMFDLNACWRWRFERKDAEVRSRLDNLDFDEQETRWKRAQADLKEIELAKIRREIIPIDEARRILESAIVPAKTRLLAIPSKLAIRIVACQEVNEARNMMATEIEQALDGISTTAIITDAGSGARTLDSISLDAAAKIVPKRVVRSKPVHPSRRKSNRAGKVAHRPS